MKSHGSFNFNEQLFRWLGIPLLSLFIVLFVKHDGHCQLNVFWIDYLITTLFTFSIWSTNHLIVVAFRNRLPGLDQTKRRILSTFVITSLNTVVICTMLDYALFKIFEVEGPYTLRRSSLLIGLMANTFVLSVYEGLYFFQKWNDAMVSAEELKKVNIQSQFDSLKNQVNPHFLFNSLNTLSSLVEEDSKSAVSFIQKMSNVYRYLLQGNEKSLTTIRKEIEFIDSYVYLLKTRFGDSLHVRINVESDMMEKMIPPHTLQMLVENAVKHNEVSSDHPLDVFIFNEGEVLSVSNNLQRKSSLVKSNGVGLQNIIQRYELLGGRPVVISEENEKFIVSVPVFS